MPAGKVRWESHSRHLPSTVILPPSTCWQQRQEIRKRLRMIPCDSTHIPSATKNNREPPLARTGFLGKIRREPQATGQVPENLSSRLLENNNMANAISLAGLPLRSMLEPKMQHLPLDNQASRMSVLGKVDTERNALAPHQMNKAKTPAGPPGGAAWEKYASSEQYSGYAGLGAPDDDQGGSAADRDGKENRGASAANIFFSQGPRALASREPYVFGQQSPLRFTFGIPNRACVRQVAPPPAPRTLEDVYRDHPQERLQGFEPAQLEIASDAFLQVADEAVRDWVARWCPKCKCCA
ncbi:hypothetical protein GGR56DRAFT_617518 [Xylariaceae sp. FL0804]|nr:hypothetical protein GGR56DRAFT_617518 [Xylariaceae sp. FL0804]